MDLHLLPEELAVVRFSPDESVPEWVWASGFFSVTRTNDELSVFCEADKVPQGVACVRGWRAFRVAGQINLELTGILSGLSSPLASLQISIFSISTHDTDYMIVPEVRLEDAIHVLEEAGHKFI